MAINAATTNPSVNVLLDGGPLSLFTLDQWTGKRFVVELSPEIWAKVDQSAAHVAALSDGDQPVYGLNTGFGCLKSVRIPPAQLHELQDNLIVSHAVGVGDPVPAEIVRWMLLFKISSLAQGFSGISRNSVAGLCALLNADILPVVPAQGSLGASGDLAPLAHMALPLLGRGEVEVGGKRMSAAEALRSAKLSTVSFAPKDGLALINGTQFMCAYAAECIIRARRLLKLADIVTSMSLDAARGCLTPFDERLNALRPHRGATESASNLRRLLANSQMVSGPSDKDRVQDPYSLRCAATVHGASRDAVRHAADVVETEINSVTDNPIILGSGEAVSGGLFHGQPLALALDYLAIALSELASISERRIYLLLSGIGGLPPLLMKETGVNSGFMIVQYTAAALVSENKGLCMPASVDSIPTSLGQEDHVSMGARAGVKCRQVLQNAETVLAIELLCAAQGLDFQTPLQPGAGPLAAHRLVRQSISHAAADREFGLDIRASLALARSGEVVRAVESAVGGLH